MNDTFFKITFVGARGGLNQSQLISSNISAQVTTVQNGSPGSPLTTDQRGIRRPRDGDGNGSALPDLGAVEASLALVTTLADAGTGSLRAAVAEVAAQPGADTIFFASTLSGGTITLANEFDVTDASPVTIDATALSPGLTLDGKTNTRHFTVQTGSALTLRGLTLIRGFGVGEGGGSIANSGTLNLSRCTLANNYSDYSGGAISSFGVLTATECTFSDNIAADTRGGAVVAWNGTVELLRCTLSRNTAGNGGAIWLEGVVGPEIVANLSHCTISGNRSTDNASAGGLRVANSSLALQFCTVSQNAGMAGWRSDIERFAHGLCRVFHHRRKHRPRR